MSSDETRRTLATWISAGPLVVDWSVLVDPLSSVMLLLVVIWALTGADYFWPIWPMLGWGVGIVMHAASVFGENRFGPAWEDRKTQQAAPAGGMDESAIEEESPFSAFGVRIIPENVHEIGVVRTRFQPLFRYNREEEVSEPVYRRFCTGEEVTKLPVTPHRLLGRHSLRGITEQEFVRLLDQVDLVFQLLPA